MFKRLNFKQISIEVIVAILLIIWIYTGISKLADIFSFRIQLLNSPIFKDHAKLVSIVGPTLELVVAALLIIRKTRLLGMYASMLLMLFFSYYVYYLMVNLPTLPCSCGGIIAALSWPQHLAFNIVLFVLSLIGIILLSTNKRNKKFSNKKGSSNLSPA